MTVWVCSKCGMAGCQPLASRPSIDDRFAVGYCAGSCTPEPVVDPKHPGHTKPAVRATVSLVRNENWDPALLEGRRERAEEERFIRDFGNGKFARMSRSAQDAAAQRMASIRARWDREAAERRSA